VEGRLAGGTRTLIGGFGAMLVGGSPVTEDLEARDGRRMDPADFLTTSEATVVHLVSGASDLRLDGFGANNTGRTLT
jgi:hypothetical protein